MNNVNIKFIVRTVQKFELFELTCVMERFSKTIPKLYSAPIIDIQIKMTKAGLDGTQMRRGAQLDFFCFRVDKGKEEYVLLCEGIM